MIVTLHFHNILHTMYEYVLNEVVKILQMFPSILITTPLYLGCFLVDTV